MYQTKGELTKNGLKEIGYIHIFSLLTIGDLIYNCIVMVFFLIHIVYGTLFYPVIAIIVIVVYDSFKLTEGIRAFHKEMERNNGAVEIITEFNDLGVNSKDTVSGHSVIRKYEALKKIVITDTMIVLIAVDRTFFPVFRKDLAGAREEEFIDFLKSKPTQIKWAGKEKEHV